MADRSSSGSGISSMEIVDDEGEILSLPDHYKGIPLEALRISSRKKLSKYLNIQSEIVNEDTGHVNDYQGLGELIGFDYHEIKNFERQKNPTEELLDAWTQRSELRPTVGNLWKFLLELGRIDVIEDCRQIITKDIETYIEIRERFENDYRPVQEDTVSQSTETAPDHYVDETAILCKDDVKHGRPQLFDAFVCYNPEGDDLKFVKKMIKMLEGPEHNLKLFVPWRDDLPGGARFVIDAKLIESRCRRMVIIMSRNYIKSSACDFQVKFAHALSPGARSKKLIPVLIEPNVKIPQILRHVTLCDFTKLDLMEWFWDRLSKAIRAPLEPDKPTFSISSSNGVESSSPSSEDTGLPAGIAFETSGHSEVRSEWSHQAQSLDSGLSLSLSCASQSSMDCSIGSSPGSVCSFQGSYDDTQLHQSVNSCHNISNNSEVVYQRNTAVIRPFNTSQSPTATSSHSSHKKSGIFGFFKKPKKHHSNNTSSKA